MRSPPSLSFADPAYLEELLRRYLEDPNSVDESWRLYFAGYLDGGGAGDQAAFSDGLGIARLVEAYRHHGHRKARLDPLGLDARGTVPELAIETHRLNKTDLHREFEFRGVGGLVTATLAELVSRLEQYYCGTTGYEVAHLEDSRAREWLEYRIEKRPRPLGTAARRRIVERLIAAESFERFLKAKFPGTKRFSGEGVDAQYVLLEHLVERAAGMGADEFVIGPVHRGRLMLMANYFEKPLAAILAELAGTPAQPDGLGLSGDVTYHLGLSADREIGGKRVHFSMIPNPSHLEAIDPVVMGQARAKQVYKDDMDRTRTVPLLYHTDAAVIGQGVVAEVAQLAGLRGFSVGGTIHVIVNNQIGFSTSPADGRTSTYCSDFAKVIGAPVIHVNADDAEAAARAGDLAAEYRQTFKRDVVIDLVGYRRLGHNELDEPRFTQPGMYAAIDAHPTVRRQVQEAAVAEGLVTGDECAEWEAAARTRYEEGYKAAQRYKANRADGFEGRWRGFRLAGEEELLKEPETGVPEARLKALGRVLTDLPEGFSPGEKVEKFLEARRASVEAGSGINWSTAEALAFASLLADGTPVRMSGEDCTRGVFTQRHAILRDTGSGARHSPFDAAAGRARFEIYDSPLSEYAVMGFEYGYSWTDPHTLTLWEAQFGDFANGAQIVVDQFVSAAEDKWLKSSGLVILLPHGLEGGGPEHSSARLERYLALCARGNMRVVNPTNPANYFHALRRQIVTDYRKPLIVMTPKSLLRHKAAVSDLSEMGEGTRFRPVLADVPKGAGRIVLCSGKVYYDLRAAAGKRRDIGFVRLEQLYPLDAAGLRRILAAHREAEIVWCQEEPANMGAWSFVEPRLAAAMEAAGTKQARPRYAGRPANPSPAPALGEAYAAQQRAVVEEALS